MLEASFSFSFWIAYLDIVTLALQTDDSTGAQQVERDLLCAFDYAWNTRGNGARRSHDILAKLFKDWPAADGSTRSSPSSKRWMLLGTKRVGVTVEAWRPSNFSGSEKPNIGNFWYFLKKQPHEVLAAQQSAGFTTLEFTGVRCGVFNENGVPCNALPVKGRKRCLIHKGMRVRLPVSNQITAGALNKINTSRDDDQGAVCLPRLLFGSFSLNSKKEGERPKSLSFNSWVKSDSEGRIQMHNNSEPRCTNSLQTECSSRHYHPTNGHTIGDRNYM